MRACACACLFVLSSIRWRYFEYLFVNLLLQPKFLILTTQTRSATVYKSLAQPHQRRWKEHSTLYANCIRFEKGRKQLIENVADDANVIKQMMLDWICGSFFSSFSCSSCSSVCLYFAVVFSTFCKTCVLRLEAYYIHKQHEILHWAEKPNSIKWTKTKRNASLTLFKRKYYKKKML